MRLIRRLARHGGMTVAEVMIALLILAGGASRSST
jgi:prepilin-type N-terminal cleavage/methylation domain-containing protein